jgi:hypothetical protein
MSIYETPSQLPILAAMLPGAVIWDAETTATAADPYPGPAAPDRGTELVWSTSGDVDTAADVVELRVERNGYPGGALAVQQRLTGATNWNGWDAPTGIKHIELPDWTASTVYNERPSICALPDGRVVIVAEDTSDKTIRAIVREIDGTFAGPQDAYVVTDQPCDASPCIIATDDGFVRIYFFRAVEESPWSGSDFAQICVLEARDDAASADLADGTAWELVVSDALDTPIDGSVDWPQALSVAAGGGQVVAVYQYNSTIVQAYSADGYRFSLVTGSVANTGTARFAVAYEAGRFVLAYYYSNGLFDPLAARSVANAATAFSTVDAVSLHGAQGADGRPAMTGDGQGNIWIWEPAQASAEDYGYCWVSSDGGATFDSVSQWWLATPADAGVQISACWWRDRALIVSRAPSATGYDDSLILMHLGGWDNVVHRRRSWGPTQIGQRTAWTRAWAPVVAPNVAMPQSGAAATAAFTTNGGYRITVAGGGSYRLNGYTTAIEGARYAFSAALDVASGSCGVFATWSDAINQWRADLIISATGLDLQDAGTGLTLATATISGQIEVMVWSYNGFGGAWYRAWGASEWTLLYSGALTSFAGTTGSAFISFGASSDVEVFCLRSFGPDEPLVRDSAAEPLVSGATAPGLPVSGTRQYLANGVYARAARGPGRVGDSWTIEAASPFGAEYAAWTAENNSPARAWQSTGVAPEALAWEFADDPIKMEPLWAIHWRGDVQAIWYSWHNGTTWGTETSAGSYLIRSCVRYGSRLVINSGTSGAFVQADELVGGFAVDADNKARRIVANTAGVAWQGSTTLASTVITIEADGTERTSSSSWRIVWPQGVAIVQPPSTAQGLRVRVAVSGGIGQTPTGKHSLKVLAGPCVVLGLPHGNDTQMEHEAQPRSFEAPNGRRRTAQAAPARRVVTLTWQSTLDRLWQVQGYSGNEPDVIAWDTLPLYSRGEAASTLRACVERWAAAGTPVLYLPRVDITGESATFPQTWVQHRAGGVIVGTLDPLWTVEGAGRGLEQKTEIVRLGALTITELT